MKKNIIITGGNGQDAKILARSIKKYQINFLIKKKDKFLIKNKNITYSKINLLNYKDSFNHIRKKKPYAIIHLASKNNSSNQKKNDYKLEYKNNLLMTKNLLNIIKNYDKKIKFIFAGSSLMFQKKNGIVNEKSKFKHSNFYSKYKIHSHMLLIKFKKKYNLNASTVILFNHDSIYRNKKFLLPRIVQYLKTKNLKKINEINKENIYGDFSHAEDICSGILRLVELRKMPDKLILSSSKLTSINKLIKYGTSFFKIKVKLQKPNRIPKKLLIGNNNLAKKILRWKNKKNAFLAFKEILKNS